MHAVAIILLTLSLLVLTVFPTGAFIQSLCVAALLLSGGAALVSTRRPGPAAAAPRLPPTAAALGVTVLFLFASTVPLPLEITALLHGPARYEQNMLVSQTLQDAATAGVISDTSAGYALTRNKAGTLRFLLLVCALFGAATLASGLPPRHRVLLLRIALLFGIVIGAAGIISLTRIPQNSRLWWVYPIAEAIPGPVACFTNRNHFAGMLGMLVPVSLALMAADARNRRWAAAVSSALAAGILTAGVAASLSRGAILSLAAGVAVLVVSLAASRRFVAAFVIFLAVAGGALLLAATPTVRERLSTLRDLPSDQSYTYRTNAWRDSMRAFRAYPVMGAGANAFRNVYPQHRTTTRGSEMSHAENEFVQLLVDGGLAGVLLVIALAVALARDWRAGANDPAFGILRIAGASALAVAATHALFDFAFHIPLYAVTLGLLAGTALPPLAAHGWRSWPHVAGAAIAILATLLWRNDLRLDSAGSLTAESPARCAQALVWTPTYWGAWFTFGDSAIRLKTTPARELGLRCMTQATRYDPNNYRLWVWTGEHRLAAGDKAGAAEAFSRVKELRDWVWTPGIPEDTP